MSDINRNEFFRLAFRRIQMGKRPSRYASTSSVAEWEVADHEVMIRARNYRIRLQKTWNDLNFRQIISDIQEYYLASDVKKIVGEHTHAYQFINRCFQEAFDTNDVKPIVVAYTSGTSFHRVLNNDLAQMISTDDLRDIRISLDAPGDRCYWEGSLDVACILLNHPQLNCCEIKEEMTVYRGMAVEKNVLERYSPGKRLMNKTFLSTSKLSLTTVHFSGSSPDKVACLCIFTLVPNERRTAIDIGNLSLFPGEEEVLILPYATFIVTNAEFRKSATSSERYVIELRECHDEIDVD